MPCGRFVQENALWCTKRCRAAVLYRKTPSVCTKRCRAAVLYRKTPSGVPSDAARLFCTWERPLVYQVMPCCFVHGNALWCTKRCRTAVLYMGTPSGVPSDAARLFCTGSALWCTKRCRAAVLYMGAPSGVPSDAARLFCTWERPLVYQAMPCCRFVQERGLWCTGLMSCRMR